jgi:hypothetical protein
VSLNLLRWGEGDLGEAADWLYEGGADPALVANRPSPKGDSMASTRSDEVGAHSNKPLLLTPKKFCEALRACRGAGGAAE